MTAVIIKAIMALLTKLLMATCSEKVIEWAFFYVAQAIVKTTKTNHDDEFYNQVKAAYEQGK